MFHGYFHSGRVPDPCRTGVIVTLIALSVTFLAPAHAAVQVSAGESTVNDYQDAIGGGGTVEGDIFGGEQVRPAPDRLETGDRRVITTTNSSRAARHDVAWLLRLWSWIRMSWRTFGTAPIR